MKSDACTREQMGRRENLFVFGVAPHRNHMRVLHEHKPVYAFAALPFLNALLLDPKRLLPSEPPQIQNFTLPHNRPEGRTLLTRPRALAIGLRAGPYALIDNP
jgi:hypothetical protein